jgi:hypothetical protein
MQGPPKPLVPFEIDLRDFPYMPLDVVRLRDSELAVVLSGEEFRSAVLLWCACWHQVPASSLPDDDRLLASLAGFGRDLKGWKAVRQAALRGFKVCSDGRLYHPVIAEKAQKAHAQRRGQVQRTAAATAARRKIPARVDNNRDDDRDDQRDDRDVDPRGDHQGKGREEILREDNRIPDLPTRGDPPSIFSNENFELTDQILQAQRLDRADPAAIGAVHFAKRWMDQGWKPALIIATIERVMSKRHKAPNNLKYFENAIADAHAEFVRPLPVGTATGPPRRAHKKTYAELAVDMEALVNAQAAANPIDSERVTVIDGETRDRLRDQST